MAGHVAWHWIDAQLRSHRSIWLSTTKPDGHPHAMPTWYWWEGEALYFITGEATQKARNLAHQPEVVVHGWDGDDVVIIEGSVVRVTDLEERARAEEAYSSKYVDPLSGARATTYGAGDALFRVDVRRVMAWMYGTVGSRTDYVPGVDGWRRRG